MRDENKTKAQLIDEIIELRQRVAKLETAEIEFRQAEEILFQSREMLQLVLDTIPQRVFWKDRNFSYLGCNRLFAKDAGLKEPSEIVGMNDFDLGWKELAPIYRDDDKLVMDRDTAKLNFEEPLLTSEGQRRWLQTSKVPIHDSDGKVIGILGSYEDITERKQSEETLKNEKAILDALMDNIPDSIYFKDRQCRLVRINRKELHDLNLDDMSQVVGKTDVDLFGEEFGRMTLADDQRLMETGKPIIGLVESRQLANGHINWTLTNKVPLYGTNGEVVGLVGITREINELMRTQEELQHERNLLRTLIDNWPDYIYVKDIEGRFIIGNTAVVRQLGFTSEDELIGKTDFDLFPHELATRYFAEEQAILQSGKGIYNYEGPTVDVNKEEKERWVMTTKVPLWDTQGKIIGTVGIGRDITERKQIEESLRRERNLLRTLIDNLPDLIFFKDAEGRYILNNRTHLKSIGIERQEDAIGKRSYDFHPSELVTQYIADETKIVQTGQAMIDREEIVEHRDTGERRWHLTSKIPLKDAQGKIMGFVGIARDITEHKRAEAEREQLINELQKALAEVKTLSGLLPICSNCKKIRDDQGY